MHWTQNLFLSLLISLSLVECSKSTDPTSVPHSGSSSPSPQTTDTHITTLIESVRQTGGKSTDGNLNSRICALASQHLDYMISQGEISHDGFLDRSNQMRQWGGSGSGEIVASNCSGGLTLAKGAKTCANSWVNSPGHWEQMKKYWDNYCYEMRESGNCMYCIGLFANGSMSN